MGSHPQLRSLLLLPNPKKQKKQKTQKTLTPQEQAAKENTEKFHTQMRTAADSLKFLKSLPLDEGSMADSIKTVAKTALAGFYDDLPALQKDVGRLAKFYTWIRRRNNKKEFVESQENFALLCETFGLEKPPNTTSTEEAATEAFAESLERAVGEIREAFQTSITAHLPRPSKKSKTNQGDAVASMLNDVDIERILLGSLYAADKTSALPRMAQAMYFTLGNYAQARRMAFSQGEYASEKVLEQNAAAGEGAVEVVVNATDN